MARQNRTPFQDCLAEARRLAEAGKGMEAAVAHRVQSIAQVILAAEAARAAEEELADAVRAAGVCDLTVAELASASGRSRTWGPPDSRQLTAWPGAGGPPPSGVSPVGRYAVGKADTPAES